MRTTAILFAALATMLPAGTVSAADNVTLSLPPESIAQWYKPQNERQVWLHTMFRLRRAMQAVGLYAALEDNGKLKAWSAQLVKDYRRIPEMVPEWEDEVDLEWADRLERAGASGDRETAAEALNELATTCRSCHNEFQATTAAIYRSPNFHDVAVENPETLEMVPYHDLMEGLSTSLNRVIIGVKDGRWPSAATATDKLESRMEMAAESCGGCHDDEAPRQRIFGGTADELEGLRKSIEAKDGSSAGRHLGNIGVTVCARCHGVHRTLADLREMLLEAGAPPVPGAD